MASTARAFHRQQNGRSKEQSAGLYVSLLSTVSDSERAREQERDPTSVFICFCFVFAERLQNSIAIALTPSNFCFENRFSNYVQSRSGEIVSYLQQQIPSMASNQKRGGAGGFTFVAPRDAKEAAANAFSQKND